MHQVAADYTHQNTPRSLYLAALARPFPDWVAAEDVPQAASFEKKASQAFADAGRRLLPIDTKVNAFFSAVDYFAHADGYTPEVMDRVKSACEHFGILPDVAPYAEVFAERFEKSAAEAPVIEEGRFAIDTEIGGRRYRLLPINTPSEITKAAGDLVRMATESRIHYLQLVEASIELSKAAAEQGVEKLPDLVLWCGEARLPDWEKAASKLESRNGLTAGSTEAMASYRAVLADAVSEKIEPHEALMKIASIDHSAGLNYKLTRKTRYPLPHEIVYSGPRVADVEKQASEEVLIRGHLVPFTAFKKIPDVAIDYRMEKEAGAKIKAAIKDLTDARPFSLLVQELPEGQQVTLFKMAAEFDE